MDSENVKACCIEFELTPCPVKLRSTATSVSLELVRLQDDHRRVWPQLWRQTMSVISACGLNTDDLEYCSLMKTENLAATGAAPQERTWVRCSIHKLSLLHILNKTPICSTYIKVKVWSLRQNATYEFT